MKINFALLLTLIFLFLLSACFPGNKKIAVPDFDRSLPSAETQKSRPSISVDAMTQEVKDKGPVFDLSESLKLESAVAYQRSEKGAVVGALIEESLALPPAGPLPKKGVGIQLSQEYLEARLASYNEKQLAWNEMVGTSITLGAQSTQVKERLICALGAQRVAAGYQYLLGVAQSGVEQGQIVGDAGGVSRQDISFLESGCDAILRQINSENGREIDGISRRNVERMESLVAEYTMRGDYPGVVSAYENIALFLPPERIEFSVTYQYAQALIYGGFPDKARDVLRQSLTQAGVIAPSSKGNLVGLERQAVGQYADLLLVLGDEIGAKDMYLRLDDDFSSMEKDNGWVSGQLHFLADYGGNPEEYADYLDLLSKFVASDGSGVSADLRRSYARFLEKYSEFGLQSGARRIMHRAEEQVRAWGGRKLAVVQQLMAEGDLVGAKKLLSELKNLPEDMVADIERVSAKIRRAEKNEIAKGELLEKEELTSRWRDALALFEQKKYEQAITSLSSLLSSDYGVAVQEKRQEAIEKLASGLRREAANLFVAAQKTDDVQEKKELLRRSRLMLLDILRKYPGVDIADKINNNLLVLDRHIQEFDPEFLELLNYSQKK